MTECGRGRVIISHGSEHIVEDVNGVIRRCLARRNLGQVLCGDRVSWRSEDGVNYAIEEIERRDNVVARPNFKGKIRPLAANVDQMIVVQAVAPGLDLDLLDRYLVLAEHLGIQALVWVNKTDLLPNLATMKQRLAGFGRYRALGYTVLSGSTHSTRELDELRTALIGRTSILVGQSGVGKSSIVAALHPSQDVRIGALSRSSGLGRHTTTETTLYHLPGGGDLIDSPGIRRLRVGHLSEIDVAMSFREFRPYLGQCRFADCRHEREPGCRLRQAVEAGAVSQERLDSFHRIVESLRETG